MRRKQRRRRPAAADSSKQLLLGNGLVNRVRRRLAAIIRRRRRVRCRAAPEGQLASINGVEPATEKWKNASVACVSNSCCYMIQLAVGAIVVSARNKEKCRATLRSAAALSSLALLSFGGCCPALAAAAAAPSSEFNWEIDFVCVMFVCLCVCLSALAGQIATRQLIHTCPPPPPPLRATMAGGNKWRHEAPTQNRVTCWWLVIHFAALAAAASLVCLSVNHFSRSPRPPSKRLAPQAPLC